MKITSRYDDLGIWRVCKAGPVIFLHNNNYEGEIALHLTQDEAKEIRDALIQFFKGEMR